ncbi:lamin tail domain-containing protein [Chitinophaga rhizophila]|uniref:Lamin tail domain-containing protein n=1 Tax=Chitinophaga rhizophila TaxID=2866212 RepID=A0ABS7GDZ8_9BACT|nr:lamin tail domain-containing protein [Chitinophaga rhizophila]MBW8685900.1 lamin tail domain-containing protein [Chitinophaga rhizophila]
MSIVCAYLLLQVSFSFAQVNESFDYQSIRDLVAWKGSDTAWSIQQGRLKSHLQQASTAFYISTPSLLAQDVIWEWWLQLDFNTSSLNYTDVFLTADSANLLAPALKGYFVRIGNTKDDICLYRKDGASTPVLLIDGRDGITDHTSSTLKIKVIRKEDSWELWTDEKANGTAYTREGIARDNRYNTSKFMGITIRQSTASFFRKHYFDNISVHPFTADTTPPSLLGVQLMNDRTLSCCFSEIPDSAIISNFHHISLSDTANAPVRIWQDSHTPACINIVFRNPFPNGDSCSIYIKGVNDTNGNAAPVLTATFLYYLSSGYDVLIHEFLPKALPSAGLLPARFIELLNNSPFALQLKGWRIGNSSREITLPSWLLLPGDYVVLCDKQAVESFPAGLPLLGLSSFPAPGDSDYITLRNDSGLLVHAIAYDRQWYNNPVKAKGGWSLEMISPQWPCAGSSNWRPSNATAGGTPGMPNTAAGPGQPPPSATLVHAYVQDSMTIHLFFSAMMDSLAVSTATHYIFDPAIPISSITAKPPLYHQVSVQLTTPLAPDQLHSIRIAGVNDCSGQPVTVAEGLTIARMTGADSAEVIFNEILYDPAPGTPEFIELYNRGTRAIDLSRLFFARIKAGGEPEDAVPLTSTPRLLAPGAYMAFTTAPEALCRQYDCPTSSTVQQFNLPALINAEGGVVLLNASGNIVDELYYSDKMHQALAGNTRGVSLERLHPDSPTRDRHNWHSAAVTVKYGTPGRTNSQQLPVSRLDGALTVHPGIFSPDNDGQSDVAVLSYRFPLPGCVMNVMVFDAEGRLIRTLEKNIALPQSGHLIWDGRGDQQRELTTGIYIIFAEAVSPTGDVRQWKLPVVLGKKLNG